MGTYTRREKPAIAADFARVMDLFPRLPERLAQSPVFQAAGLGLGGAAGGRPVQLLAEPVGGPGRVRDRRLVAVVGDPPEAAPPGL